MDSEMALKVEIVSREVIKPSSPTPPSRRTFKLSLLDQLVLPIYVPIILFYSTTVPEGLELQKISDCLKQSLSKTLNHMYPLAARIDDTFSIQCNDQGVEYIEAHVRDSMSTVLKHPTYSMLTQLFPPDPLAKPVAPGDRELLSVQVNHFGCGGIAVGILISHRIADMSAVSMFLKTWADIARGGNIVDNFTIDCATKLAPLQEINCFINQIQNSNFNPGPECRSKARRFIFSGSNIAALREKATQTGYCSERPSRVVAVFAFIWASIIAADGGRKDWHMTTFINVRNKMDPPILPHILGNFVHSIGAEWDSAKDTINYGDLVNLVKDSIAKVNSEFVNKTYADSNEYFNSFKRQISEYPSHFGEAGIIFASSWCRFPLYDTDFGFGKPIWVGTNTYLRTSPDYVTLLDTSDGEGVEAWVKLSEEVMNEVEKKPDFLAYVSSCQSL